MLKMPWTILKIPMVMVMVCNGALVEQRCPSYDPQTSLPIHPIGLSPTSDDCDDADPSISPSAMDCAAIILMRTVMDTTLQGPDVSTFLVDTDGDGFGSGETDTNGDWPMPSTYVFSLMATCCTMKRFTYWIVMIVMQRANQVRLNCAMGNWTTARPIQPIRFLQMR